MGASREKEKRKQARVEGTDPKQARREIMQKQAKRDALISKLVSWTAIVILVFIVYISVPFLRPIIPAAQAGGTTFTVAEYNYHYFSLVNSYKNGQQKDVQINFDKPLSSQNYSETQTWEQYFDETIKKSLTELGFNLSGAKREKLKLSAEENSNIDNYIQSVVEDYQRTDTNPGVYLSNLYGKGQTLNSLRTALEHVLLANKYMTEKLGLPGDMTVEQATKIYEANKDKIDVVNYKHFFIAKGAKTAAQTDEQLAAAAKTNADAMYKEITQENFGQIAAKYASEADKKSLSENPGSVDESANGIKEVDGNFADFLFNAERKAGDKIITEENDGYNVVMFTSRDKTSSVAVRHILYKSTQDDKATPTAAQKAAAKPKADKALADWKAAGSKKDAYISLAKEVSEDPGSKDKGGLYNDVKKGDMVPEFDAWCFDPARKVGDVAVIETSFGAHFMYFEGLGSSDYRVKATEIDQGLGSYSINILGYGLTK